MAPTWAAEAAAKAGMAAEATAGAVLQAQMAPEAALEATAEAEIAPDAVFSVSFWNPRNHMRETLVTPLLEVTRRPCKFHINP